MFRGSEKSRHKGPENIKVLFRTDEYLEDPEFVRFLAMNRPEMDMKEPPAEELVKLHESYEKANKYSVEVKNVLKDKILETVNIEYKDEWFSVIDDYMRRKVIEDPELIDDIVKNINQSYKLKDTITKLQNKARKIGDKQTIEKEEEDLKENVEQLESYKRAYKDLPVWKRVSLIRPFLSDRNQQIVEKYKTSYKRRADEVIRKHHLVLGNLERIEDIEKEKAELEKDMNGLRLELKWHMGGTFEGILTDVQGIIKDKLTSYKKETDLSKLEQAQAFLQKLEDNYILGGKELQEFQEKIDLLTEASVSRLIEESVAKLPPESLVLSKMEETIKKVYKKKQVGSKTGAQIRDFMTATLNDIRAKQPDTLEGKAKQLLLRRIESKLNNIYEGN